MLFPAVGVLAAGKRPGALPPLFSVQGDISLLSTLKVPGKMADHRAT